MTTLHFAASDLEKSMAFYRALLGRQPKKTYEDLAIFELKALTIELAKSTPTIEATESATYGLAVATPEMVTRQARRLEAAGLSIDLRVAENCCHSLQTKAWTVDPDGRRWKTYAVLYPATLKGRLTRLGESWQHLFNRERARPDDVVTDSLERTFFERELRNYSRGFGSDTEHSL